SAADSMRRLPPPPATPRGGNGSASGGEAGSVRAGGRVRGPKVAGSVDVPGQTGLFGEDSPPPMPSPVPTSATFAPARTPGSGPGIAPGAATALAERPRPLRDPDDITD